MCAMQTAVAVCFEAPAGDTGNCCRGYEFQTVILVKLVIMDVPQQVLDLSGNH